MIPALLALANLAPVLMKYIGGSDSTVGKVVSVASDIAVSLTGAKTPEEAVIAISKDPEKLAAFQLQVMQQSIEWDKLFLADIQSARDRDVQLAKTGYRNYRAHALVICAYTMIIVCFIAVLTSSLDDYQKTTLALILGRMLGYIDQAYNFEFGTTRSSQHKDDTINKLTSK